MKQGTGVAILAVLWGRASIRECQSGACARAQVQQLGCHRMHKPVGQPRGGSSPSARARAQEGDGSGS